MCLYVKSDALPETAVADIQVYKVFKLMDGGILHSPYRQMVYRKSNSYRSDLDSPVEIDVTPFESFLYEKFIKNDEYDSMVMSKIERGIHSFANYEDALDLVKWCTDMGGWSNFVMVPCTIPAGSTYYKGGWETSWMSVVDSYASNKITLSNVVIKK